MDSKNNTGYLNEDFKIFYLKDCKSVNTEYHHHNFKKIVIFISGDAKYIVEGKTYILKPWDVLFINKNEIHKCISDNKTPYERLVIWIRDDIEEADKYFLGLTKCFEINKQISTSLLRLKENSCNTLKNLVNKILKYNTENMYDIALRNTFFIQMLVILNKAYLNKTNLDTASDVFYDKTTERLISYINENLSKPLDIELLSEKFELSKHYLMRKFKKQTGYSIHSYIVQKRLMFAIELMRKESCMYIIAEDSGFNEYSKFVRAFKKYYDLSPKKYYENHSRIESINIID